MAWINWVDDDNTAENEHVKANCTDLSLESSEQASGFQAGETAKAKNVNAALRQANVVACALMDLADPNGTLSGLSKRDDIKNLIKTGLFSLIYPVGSIYMSISNANPSTLFGGTWIAWGSGRVPVGVNTTQSDFNTVEKTGGERTHTLSAPELPKQSVPGTTTIYTNELGTSGSGNTTLGSVGVDRYAVNYTTESSSQQKTVYSTPKLTETYELQLKAEYGLPLGSGKAHNNLQPYITCYMWKRTA